MLRRLARVRPPLRAAPWYAALAAVTAIGLGLGFVLTVAITLVF